MKKDVDYNCMEEQTRYIPKSLKRLLQKVSLRVQWITGDW